MGSHSGQNLSIIITDDLKKTPAKKTITKQNRQ